MAITAEIEKGHFILLAKIEFVKLSMITFVATFSPTSQRESQCSEAFNFTEGIRGRNNTKIQRNENKNKIEFTLYCQKADLEPTMFSH
jgi:hypothetical protein